MRIKMVQTAVPVHTPNGGGSTAYFLREGEFEMVMEGAFIRVRRKGIREGQVYSIPMANVASLEQAETRVAWGDETPPKPEKK